MIFVLYSPLGHEYIWFWILGGCMSIIALVILLTLFKQDKFEGKSVETLRDETVEWN